MEAFYAIENRLSSIFPVKTEILFARSPASSGASAGMGANSAFRSALPCPKKAMETMAAIRGNSGERLLSLFSGGFADSSLLTEKQNGRFTRKRPFVILNRGNFYLVLLP